MANKKKILLTGASGFIGSAAADHFRSLGYTVIGLSRRPATDTLVWDPSAGRIDPLPGDLDAIVHLAGENIFGRWTKGKKQRIYRSRIDGTKLLAEQVAAAAHKPKVLVCASAVGFYGDRGDDVLTEAAPPGKGFLADVCRDWEAAAAPARQAGIRTTHLRFGMVLDKQGGALAKMLSAFKMALGGKLGNGRQWVSWISRMEVLRIIDFVLHTDSLDGPVNAVCPEPVQNHTFTRTLGQILNRPTVLPAPAFALQLALGDFARETLLASTRAIPEKLQKTGFAFQHATLRDALVAVIQ